MGEEFKKLGCYAKKVVIDKVNDDTLKIRVEDEGGDEHNLEVTITMENCQNIDTFSDKEAHALVVPSLKVDYSVKKTEKLNSTSIT